MSDYSNSGSRDYASFAGELVKQDTLSGAESVIVRWCKDAQRRAVDAGPQSGDIPFVGDIGIWKRTVQNGVVSFIRNGEDPSEFCWSATETIAPKPASRQRIVLLGESVANGFPFSPLFSCVSALRQILNVTSGGTEIEVIDIAKNGLNFQGLLRTMRGTHQLDPDICVIYAGNNWQISTLTEALDFRRIASVLKTGGNWKSVATYFEELLRREASRFLKAAARFLVDRGISVTFVIPEYNLLDWPYDPSWHNPLLFGTDCARWRSICEQAEVALLKGDLDLAEALAEKAEALDGRFSPIALNIQGRCAAAQGDCDKARVLLERSRDARLCLPILAEAVGCHSVIQDEIRRNGPAKGLTVVDLPRRLAELRNGTLPGKDLFVNHVHMNPEGIRIAMACVAEETLKLLGRKPCSAADLMNIPIHVSDSAFARGHLVAAIMNGHGHNSRSSELARNHCALALGASSDVAALMRCYIDFQTRRESNILCSTFHQFRTLAASLGGLLPVMFVQSEQKALNVNFINLLLESTNASSSETGQFHRLLESEHSVRGEVNLLHVSRYIVSRYAHTPDGRQFSYIAAHSNRTVFRFISKDPQTIQLELTFRVPDKAAAGRCIEVSVNGEPVGKHKSQLCWCSWHIVVGADLQKQGFNELVISWPDVETSREDRLEAICRRLEDPPNNWSDFLPDLYYVYGQISGFTARVAVDTGSQHEDRTLVNAVRERAGKAPGRPLIEAMKILLAMGLPYEPAFGGANKGNRIMAELLAESGHTLRAVVPFLGIPPANTVEGLRQSLRDRAIVIESTGTVDRFTLNEVDVHAVLERPFLRRYLVEQLREFDPDCVLVAGEEPSQNLLDACINTCREKVVYILFTPNFLPFGPLAFYPGKNRTELLRQARLIVATSKFSKDYARQWGGLDSTLFYPPVYGTGKFPHFGRPNQGCITLINPCRYKGIDIFLGLARDFPHLEFAAVPTWGTSGTDLCELSKLPNVRLLQASPDIDDVLCKTRVLLMPSLWLESYGIVVVEAMLRGIPVISSNCGGVPEAKLGTRFVLPVNPIVQFTADCDENGLLIPIVPQQDLSLWRDALERLTSNAAFYEAESSLVREVASRFVESLSIRDLEDILESVAFG